MDSKEIPEAFGDIINNVKLLIIEIAANSSVGYRSNFQYGIVLEKCNYTEFFFSVLAHEKFSWTCIETLGRRQ